MAVNSRRTAAFIVARWLMTKDFPANLLPEGQDRAFVQDLVYTVIRRLRPLRRILGGFLTAMIPATCKILTMFGVQAEKVVMLAGKGPLFACIAMILSILLCLVGSAIFKNEKDAKNQEFFYKAVVENE